MKIGRLRHRITFLKPSSSILNSMGETVPVWQPFHPYRKKVLNIEDGEVYICADEEGNAFLVNHKGVPYAHEVQLKDYEVWAEVAPTTGREYEEAQKLRAETTYNVISRYFPGITADMKILFRGRIMDIISVLNINERNEQLKIVAAEKDISGRNEGYGT